MGPRGCLCCQHVSISPTGHAGPHQEQKIFLIKNFIVYFNITLFSLVNFKLYKGSLVSLPAGVCISRSCWSCLVCCCGWTTCQWFHSHKETVLKDKIAYSSCCRQSHWGSGTNFISTCNYKTVKSMNFVVKAISNGKLRGTFRQFFCNLH